MELHAKVAVDGHGAEAVFSQIEEAFSEFGVDARCGRPGGVEIGGDHSVELPLYVSVSILLVPFFSALVSKAGEDAYAALKKLVRRSVTVETPMPAEAAGAVGQTRGKVAFHDAETRIQFTVDLDLPDIAFARLTRIDWTELARIRPTWQQSVTLYWDPEDHEWWIALFKARAPLTGVVGPVDETDFQAQVLDARKPVLVHFWAPWSEPCRVIEPILEEIAAERVDLRITKLNTDENPHVTEVMGILAIPALLLFRHGEEIRRILGAKPKSQLGQEIESALAS